MLKIKKIKTLLSKDSTSRLEDSLKLVYSQVPFNRKMRDVKIFVQLVFDYILMMIFTYNSTIHSYIPMIDQKKIYTILRNEYYDFQLTLDNLSLDIITNIFDSYKGKPASYISRNRIHLIFDPSICKHTGTKIEGTRKLHDSSSPTGFAEHAYKGLSLVGNYKGKIFPICARLENPFNEEDNANNALIDIILKLLADLHIMGYDTSLLYFSADREFLNEELMDILLLFNVTIVLKIKKNTILEHVSCDVPCYNSEEFAKIVVSNNRGNCNNASLNDYLSSKEKKPLYYYVKSFICLGYIYRVWIFYNEIAKEAVYKDDNTFWQNVEVFICNKGTMRALEIYKEYHYYRWSIEEPYHKDLKGQLEIENCYHGQYFTGHNNHWILSSTAMLIYFLENINKGSWRRPFGQWKRKLQDKYLHWIATGQLQGKKENVIKSLPT